MSVNEVLTVYNPTRESEKVKEDKKKGEERKYFLISLVVLCFS
jgi:hypothetical protein